MNMKIAMTVAMMLFVALPMQAAGPLAVRTLGLSDAIEIALQNSPYLKAVRHETDADAARAVEARGHRLPSIDVREVYTKTNSPLDAFALQLSQEQFSMAGFMVSDLNHPEAISDYYTSLQIQQPLYAGGAITAGIRAGEAMSKAGTLRLVRAEQAIRHQVHRAYLDVLLAGEQVKLMESVVETTQSHVDQASAYVDTGFIMEADLLQARVVLGEMEQERIRSANNEKLARANLNNIMGIGQDEIFTLTDQPVRKTRSESLNQLIEAALDNRSDLREMELKVEAASQKIRIEKADYKPKVMLIGELNYHDNNFAGLDGESYKIMAMASYNLFNGKRTRSRVRRAESLAASYTEHLNRLRSGIELQVRQATFQLEEALKRHEVAELSARQASENLRIREARYASGVETTTDLLDAATASQRASLMALQARYDCLKAQEALEFAIGLTE